MKPRIFKRAGVWFCAIPGKPGAVGADPSLAFMRWTLVSGGKR